MRLQSKASKLLAVMAALLFGACAGSSHAAETTVQPALDGVFAAFETHPLVGIAEHHNLAEEGEFYNRLVSDPRFAAEIGNVVVEFGGSAHQDIIDRYVAGEDVPYAQLRRVWGDVVGWVPTVTGVMYQSFFAQVRAVNQGLAPGRRIRVWLGEPPIDWAAVRTSEDYYPYLAQRDEYPAAIIRREILGRGKKALVIYGAGHFNRIPFPASVTPPPGADLPILRELVERTHPEAFYVITAYVGYPQKACSVAFEDEMAWPAMILASPVKGTPLETALLRPGCSAPPPRFTGSGAEQERIQAVANEIWTGAAGDALLYLEPAADLTPTPTDTVIILDEAHFRELARRVEIMGVSPPTWSQALPAIGSAPQPLWPR